MVLSQTETRYDSRETKKSVSLLDLNVITVRSQVRRHGFHENTDSICILASYCLSRRLCEE